MLPTAFFSLAHVHHAFERYREGQRHLTILIETLVQSSYTYIFGVISVIIFTRTGHLTASIVSHVICNFMGLPQIDFMSKESYSEYRHFYPYRYIFLFLYAFGLVLFAYCLYPFTAELARDSMYWLNQFSTK